MAIRIGIKSDGLPVAKATPTANPSIKWSIKEPSK